MAWACKRPPSGVHGQGGGQSPGRSGAGREGAGLLLLCWVPVMPSPPMGPRYPGLLPLPFAHPCLLLPGLLSSQSRGHRCDHPTAGSVLGGRRAPTSSPFEAPSLPPSRTPVPGRSSPGPKAKHASTPNALLLAWPLPLPPALFQRQQEVRPRVGRGRTWRESPARCQERGSGVPRLSPFSLGPPQPPSRGSCLRGWGAAGGRACWRGCACACACA